MTYPDVINPKLLSDLPVSAVVRKILSAKHMDLTNCPPAPPSCIILQDCAEELLGGGVGWNARMEVYTLTKVQTV